MGPYHRYARSSIILFFFERGADSKIGNVATFLVIWKFCAANVLGVIFAIVVMIFGTWGYSQFWKQHVTKNNGLQSDGDYFLAILYPLLIIIVMAIAYLPLVK